MTKADKDFITLGADVGGKDAFTATNQHILVLRSLLRQEFSRFVDGQLKEIALVFRIDGAVQSWGKIGVENISIQQKAQYVTADIFVPIETWKGVEVYSLRRFFVDQVAHAIRLVAEELNRQKIVLDLKRLDEALENVRQHYLG